MVSNRLPNQFCLCQMVTVWRTPMHQPVMSIPPAQAIHNPPAQAIQYPVRSPLGADSLPPPRAFGFPARSPLDAQRQPGISPLDDPQCFGLPRWTHV